MVGAQVGGRPEEAVGVGILETPQGVSSRGLQEEQLAAQVWRRPQSPTREGSVTPSRTWEGMH